MKKLIAIAVVFALVAGGVFAADFGGTVFGGVRLLKGDTTEKGDEDPSISGDGSLSRIRIEGAGENDDGTFGAWLRLDPTGGNADGLVAGLAWWKPIDWLKFTIGGNPDGIYGKEGFSGWMFYQMPSDVGIVEANSPWGKGAGWAAYISHWGQYRDAFYGGYGGNGLMLDIGPFIDIVTVNVVLPYFTGGLGGGDIALKSIFKHIEGQIDLKFDFGNIAISYVGGDNEMTYDGKDYGGLDSAPRLFLFFNMGMIENLDLSLGVGYSLPLKQDLGGLWSMNLVYNAPVAIGAAVKFDINDSFGFKARLLAEVGGKFSVEWAGITLAEEKSGFGLALDLLPYIGINDSMKIFIGLGLSMYSPPVGDSIIGFHVNPYLQIGAEWGPTFYVGFRLWTRGKLGYDWGAEEFVPTDKSIINFELPIGIQVSF